MKHLFFLLLTCSMQGYGQECRCDRRNQYGGSIGYQPGYQVTPTPADTLRATLIVYYDGPSSILHTKNGFVVRQAYKDLIYLDDRKRVIKKPVEVLTYKLK